MNMRSKAAYLAILLLMTTVIVVRNKDYGSGAVVALPGLDVSLGADTEALNLTSRANIYYLIRDSPGIHLRCICASLGLSMGSTQYHLEQLVEGDLIESKKDSKYKRFFLARKYNEFEKTLLSYLRKPTARKIIELSSETEGCSHRELSDLLEISSQAVSWQVKKLMRSGLIDSLNRDGSTYYRITNKTRITLKSFLIEY